MVSTYTPNARLELQGIGDNNNTWGDVANTVFSLVDELVCGVQTVSVTTGTNVTLTANNGSSDEARHSVLKLTGTPTANISVIVPAAEKVYFVDGAFTGSFSVSIEPTGGGTPASFTAGTTGVVYVDGTDAKLLANPAGGALAALDTVGTAQIDDDAVTLAKLSHSTTNHVLQYNGGGAPVTAFVGSSNISDGAIITAKINDLAVTTAKIADDAITADKLDSTIGLQGALGTRASRVLTTIYQAEADGFFFGTTTTNTSDAEVVVYVDSSATPTTVVQRLQLGNAVADREHASWCVPVKKDDYYQVVYTQGSPSSTTGYWHPFTAV